MSNMIWKKYSSIDNVNRTKTITAIRQIVPPDEVWVVTEKAHGANYSMWFDGYEIKTGKRSSFISPSTNFMNHLYIDDKYQFNIVDLFKDVKEHFEFLHLGVVEYIIINGEIIGGSYPNLKPRDVYAKKVQSGIYYCPDNEFYAFDLQVKFKDKDEPQFIDYKLATMFFSGHNIPFAHILMEGTLDECLAYSNEFDSMIYKMYTDADGKPLPQVEGNICEGVVIKPNVPYCFHEGRVILKNKNAKWSENVSTTKAEKIDAMSCLSEDGLKWVDVINGYVNENRLRNVLSHEGGPWTHKDFGRIVGMFSKDAWQDFIKDNDEFSGLDKMQAKILSKYCSKQCSEIIRKNILNIIDGCF